MDVKTTNAVLALISIGVCKKPDNMGKVVSNLLLNEVSALLSENKTDIKEIQDLRPDFCEAISDICYLRAQELITTKHAKELLLYMWNTPYIDLCSYLISSEMLKEADSSEIIKIIDDLLSGNMKTVEQIKSGKTNAVGFFVGQTMKAVGGKGNPAEIKELILNRIESM